jgi:general L-amino acid transport system permease protein
MGVTPQKMPQKTVEKVSTGGIIMALAADLPKDSFRLSMLIYDTRYRSYTIQLVVLGLVMLFFMWLVNNTIQNLEDRGKDIGFAFLWSRAGYDIDQQLIPYTNDSTHFRALLVGLLNTLAVAIAACFFATVIGVTVGILRLSKNWLVAKLSTVYIEVFRNVPLLLWIILTYVILSETRPVPKDFKVTPEMIAAGEAPRASMVLWDSVAMTNRSTNLPAPLLDRPLGGVDFLTIPINFSVLATIAVLIASIWFNRRLLGRAKTIQEATGDRPTTWWKSILILFLPVVLLLWAMGLHWEYPALKGFNFQGGYSVAHSFTALTIAISIYSATYVAEAVRAGILAISKGQTEAAYALGLRPNRTMNLVILPQALRVIVPPMISQYLNITKNTSLGMAVSYLDIKGTLGGITLNQTGRELECMMLMMLIYLTLSLMISTMLNIFNASVKLKER